MDRKPQLQRNLFTITPINVPTFADAQSARDSDMFEGIAATISALNANFGDQDTLPLIVL